MTTSDTHTGGGCGCAGCLISLVGLVGIIFLFGLWITGVTINGRHYKMDLWPPAIVTTDQPVKP